MGTVTATVDVFTTLRYSSDFGSAYDWALVSKYSADINQRYNVFGRSGNVYNSACIPIPALSFSGVGKKITLTFNCYNPDAHTYRWALCTSNANKSLYELANAVTDANQVGAGTFKIGAIGTNNVTLSFNVAVPANKALYLFFWSYETGSRAAHINNNGITVTAEYDSGFAYIDTNGSGFAQYAVYIDTNGSGFEQYAPYIDTGSAWELLT